MTVRRFCGRHERPIEDEIEDSEWTFLAAAGVVKGQARIDGLV
ncbi:hypothetical protein [Reinekea sp. G2M2-21]|nr:hypothetical protein [Reinekea sp. G2M2-21]